MNDFSKDRKNRTAMSALEPSQGVNVPHHSGNAYELPDAVSLPELLAIAKRNLFTLLGLPLAAGLLGAYYALAQTPIYQASSLIQLDPKPNQPMARSAEIYDPGYATTSYYITQLKIIQSRKLAAQLVDRLNLDQSLEFGGPEVPEPRLIERIGGLLPGLSERPAAPAISDEKRIENAIGRVQKAVHANLAQGTTLLQIHFKSADPELAAQAANELADIYIEELLQARLDIYTKATQWIAGKLGDVTNELSQAEERLQDYRESNDLVNVGGNRSLVESELAESTRRLRDAGQIRAKLQNQYSEIRELSESPALISEAQSLLLDPVVRTVAEAVVEARSRVRIIESRYGNRHPQYIEARAKLDEAEASYLDQLRKKARGLEAELSIAKRNEREARNAVTQARQRLQALDRDEFELNMLERQVLSNRQLYDVFLARFNETESKSSYNETNARIADPAVPPKIPVEPKKKKLTVLAALFGFILALAAVVLRQILHTRFEIPEEIEELTPIPLVGVVPTISDSRIKKSSVTYFMREPSSQFSDAIRSIKTALLMALESRPTNGTGRVIALTSAEPSEGKTTLCCALAAALASNARVLLVEADLRRPTFGRHFNYKRGSTEGLAGLLTSDADVPGAVQATNIETLHYIPAGKTVANPALILESRRWEDTLRAWRNEYDFVIIDTPPVLATGDALHLVKHVDGHLLVTRAEQTHKQAFLGMLKRLETVNAHALGIIMNGANLKRNAAAGYYYYGSYQGY